MPQLLLEFFSEEIPARMQKRAEEDLARMLGEELERVAHVLPPMYVARTLSGPRRVAVVVDDLPKETLSVQGERKGPKVGAPEKAVEGFLKSAGLTSISQATVVTDPKGDFYVWRWAEEGRPMVEAIAEIVPKIARDFPWPKSMRSGTSDFLWVRPLHSILCVFDGAPVSFEVGGVKSGAETRGHRFHAPKAFAVKNAADYVAKLREAYVLADREERKAKIAADAEAACVAKGLKLVEDAGLLEEVAGLSEWPVVVLGDMDKSFLDLPGEVIRLTMRTHQRYFAVRDKAGKLAPHFITVANVEPRDGGKAIAAGNSRVLSARLNDARFFWDGDRKAKLETRAEKLKQIVFHAKLGSVWDKVERVRALAKELAPIVGADPALVDRAALLSKCDLVTEVVGEFPELQGQIGRQLFLLENGIDPSPLAGEGRVGGRAGTSAPVAEARNSDRPPPPAPSPRGGGEAGLSARDVQSIAIAIEDHYRPLGPNDRVPTDKVAITLALADKLDTLVGFWAIDEKPTGSRDPYALRRAALGVVRAALEGKVRFSIKQLIDAAFRNLVFQYVPEAWPYQPAAGQHRGQQEYVYVPVQPANAFTKYSDRIEAAEDLDPIAHIFVHEVGALSNHRPRTVYGDFVMMGAKLVAICLADTTRDVSAFLADRLKVQLRDQGKRHDLVDAVFALGDDDLVRIVARVEALDKFLKTDDGANVLAGYKRAANILAAEEKKGKGLSEAELTKGYDAAVLGQNPQVAEQALLAALTKIGPLARDAVEKEQFETAMTALAGLRAPLDLFFEQVLVNDKDEQVRRNRLLLLTQIRDALGAVADFSKIEG